MTALAILIATLCAAVPCVQAAESASAAVKFALKVDPGDRAVVDVMLSFNLGKGEKALLRQPSAASGDSNSTSSSQVEILSPSNSGYVIEPLSPPASGWLVTSGANGEVSIGYRVTFKEINGASSDPGAPGGAAAPRAISEPDLKVFEGSDVLICPRTQNGGLLAETFQVDLALSPGEKALSPWAPVSDGGSSFNVSGEKALLENFISWGKLELETFSSGGTKVIAGFSQDHSGQSSSERRAAVNAQKTLFGDLSKTLGERPELETLSVLLCGASRFGLSSPAARTLLDSAVVFSEGDSFTGGAAVAAAGGFFELWNRYAMVPEAGADAGWLQAGLSLFYPLRVAAMAGLMDSEEAYREFSRIYRSYLADPMAKEVSLAEAESDPAAQAFLAQKGAAVTASIARKLPAESEGKVRDIDWFLGQLLTRRNAFEGEAYSLVDISEILEGATGKSWDRYFDSRIRGTGAVLASEFSASDLFGSTTGFSKGAVVGKGSGRNWIYLLVAIFIIFMIPIVMSPYVRRSVKLDISMPKILPDDDED